jgi:hypothetical protein
VPVAVAVKVVPLILPGPDTTLHVIVLYVAFDGFTVPVRVSGTPTVAVVGTPEIFVTGTITIMLKFCVKSMLAEAPLVTVALTVTVPAAVVVSVLPLMEAPVVPAFDTDQVMVLLVASEGATVPESANVPTAMTLPVQPWEMFETGIKMILSQINLSIPLTL